MYEDLYHEEHRELNVEEIKRVFHHVQEDHRRLKMRIWVQKEDMLEKFGRKVFRLNPGKYPDCGTRACFAGWTLLLNKVQIPFDGGYVAAGTSISDTAAELLGLNLRQRLHLFFDYEYDDKPDQQVEYLRQRINEVFIDAKLPDRV